jgi:DNA uptake protein ComE-like DNA-binding protein
MAQRHWLDPLARRLLIATGQLPRPARPASSPAQPRAQVVTEAAALVRGWWQSGTVAPAPAADDPLLPEREQQEAIERELLALQLAQQPGRRLTTADEVERAAALGWRLDVNRATAADWLRLPGLQPAQVDLLLRLQAVGVQLSGPDDLQRLLELDGALLRSWEPLLLFRWYGDGAPAAARAQAVDLNRASAAELQQRLPELAGPRCQRLLRERQREPFAHLADLQERLQLPPAVVEQLIGRVRFGKGPAGPELPRSA